MIADARRVAAIGAFLAGWCCMPLSAQTIQVSPPETSIVTFAGFEGGFFAPTTETTWTLENTDPDPLEFSITSDQLWLTVSPQTGELPGPRLTDRTVDVTALIDAAQADSLTPGIYTATVSFANLTTGATDAQRSVSLQVAPANLSVSPAFVNVTALRDGADPPDAIVTLSGNGGVDLGYTVSWTLEPWLGVSKFRGTVPGGQTDSFAISLNTFGLAEGTYESTVTIENTTNGFGSRDLPITLVVAATQPGTVIVSPLSDLQLHGPAAGLPAGSLSYLLQNTDDQAIKWTAKTDAPWVSVSPASGELGISPASSQQNIEVRVNAAVNDLPAGNHSAVVVFAQLVTQPLTLATTEIPLDSRVVRVTADPVLDVSVPLVGGTVSVAPGESVVQAGSESSMVRSFGEVVTVTAIVENGYDFSGWAADFEIEELLENPLVISMDSSRRIGAVFTPILRTLSLSSTGAGTGSVLPSPTGMIIDNGLVSRYANGDAVSLRAMADAGSSFLGWLGNIPPETELTNPLLVTMDRDRTITAQFEEGATLSVSVTGSGRVEIIPDLLVYEVGSQVTLIARPGDGAAFVEWSGDAAGDAGTITLTLDSSMSVIAAFEEGDGTGSPTDRPDDPNSATLAIEVRGGGTVTPPGGTFARGAEVTLIASPEIGFEFSGWEGDASGKALVTVVTMENDLTIVANFTEVDAAAGRPGDAGSTGTLCGAMGMLTLSSLGLGLLGLSRRRQPKLRR